MPLNYMTHNDVIQAYTVYTHIYLIIYIWPSTISDEEGKVYCFSFIPSSVYDHGVVQYCKVHWGHSRISWRRGGSEEGEGGLTKVSADILKSYSLIKKEKI